MSQSNTFYIKQIWRQKGDVRFEQIPFKEENKANDLSQTTRPVLLLETKANGGCGAIFASGRVSEPTVVEQAIEYPGGEFLYHVPFTYEFELSDKSKGITREELQELSGQKFAPQAKAGLYEIEESLYAQLAALLQERAGEQIATPAPVQAQEPAKEEAVNKAETPKKEAQSVAKQKTTPEVSVNHALAAELKEIAEKLLEKPELRLLSQDGKFSFYPAALLAATPDLVQLEEVVHVYTATGGHEAIEQAATEAAAAGVSASPRFAKIAHLAAQLVSEGKYDRVQIPTVQKAFYRGGNLPHPYEAIELQGQNGHYVLGVDGTLYTVDGKTVQHFLGL